MTIVGAIVPEIYEIDAQEQKFLMELVNKHEGRLTAEVFKGYRKLAQRMNIERIAHEKELKKLPGQAMKSHVLAHEFLLIPLNLPRRPAH